MDWLLGILVIVAGIAFQLPPQPVSLKDALRRLAIAIALVVTGFVVLEVAFWTALHFLSSPTRDY